jgi:hypothetical protein
MLLLVVVIHPVSREEICNTGETSVIALSGFPYIMGQFVIFYQYSGKPALIMVATTTQNIYVINNT